jgi:1-acyl-sn-glycerol-3-phosphate acyltransferase
MTAPVAIQRTATATRPDATDVLAAKSPFGRDPRFVAQALKVANVAMRYFSPEVQGVDNVPQTGPVLVVGNHSGLMYIPDFWIAFDAVTRRRGLDLPIHMLTYDALLMVPGLKSLLRQLGAMNASPANAEKALGNGDLVIVYPGGDWEACRPYGERNRVDFHDRKGFVRLALRAGVPVVPMVSHGAQHSVVVLSRGDRIARRLGMASSPLRMNVMPIVLGMAIPPSPYPPPLPAAVTVKFLPALDWSAHGPDAASDPKLVDACYDEAVGAMQSALDDLNSYRRHPVLHGSSQLVRGIAQGTVHALGHAF